MAERKITEITASTAGTSFTVLGVENGVVKRFTGSSLPVNYSAIQGKPTLGTVAGLNYPNNTALFLRGDGTFATPPTGSGSGTDSFAGLSNGVSGQFIGFDKTFQSVTKANVGLSNVDNLSRASILASPALTGVPIAPTPATGTNTTQVATTAFVVASVAAGGTGSGFANPMTASGDIIIGGTSGAATRLAKGSSGYVLTIDSSTGLPAWKAAASGSGGTTDLTSLQDSIAFATMVAVDSAARITDQSLKA